jgi:hypothetical protein
MLAGLLAAAAAVVGTAFNAIVTEPYMVSGLFAAAVHISGWGCRDGRACAA